jgi:hypothetical protein
MFNRLYLKINGNYALSNRLCELRKLSGEVAEKLREKLRMTCGSHAACTINNVE